MTQKHILILGAGSIGKRHLKNFKSLGCEVGIFEPRNDRRIEAYSLGAKWIFTDYNKVLEHLSEPTTVRFDGILIGTPPHIHAQQIIDICNNEIKIPIFSEKPLTTTLEDAKRVQDAVIKNGNPFMLGYCWRAAEPIKKITSLLIDNKIGKPLHANMTMAAYLPDWHPWEDYRDFFVSKRSWGGGALYENHWLDLMLWWFGMPNELMAVCDKISDLELEEGTDDNVDVIFTYNNGLRVYLHLDLYSRPHNKSIEIVGDKGTLQWSYNPNFVVYSNDELLDFEEAQIWHYNHIQRNDMFLAEAQGFLDLIDGVEGDKAGPPCGLQDGINVLEMIELIRQSAEEKRCIKVTKS